MYVVFPTVRNGALQEKYTSQRTRTANADSDVPKKPVSVFCFKLLPKATHDLRNKKQISEPKHSNKPSKKLEQGKRQKEEHKNFRKLRRKACEAKKGVKKLKLSSCKPKSIKSSQNSSVASTSNDSVIRCSACEEVYCDPPTEEWIQCCKYREWGHEECSNYEKGTFICDYC
ncbi:hypothetical protein TNCV_3158031 [Trichonephila clavipes]|nr:hypothetical protein TNCV_3158031 [Trichonephila clavipes]